MRLGRGAVVVVELDPTVGHEQRGVRPGVVAIRRADRPVAINRQTEDQKIFR